MTSTELPVRWGNYTPGVYDHVRYNQTWAPESAERKWYSQDVRWAIAMVLAKEPLVGHRTRKVRSGKTLAQLRRPGEDVVRDGNPEDQWIVRRPPVKDENGIPIPLPVMGRRPDYGVKSGTRMRINGRWHQWTGGRWVPLARRVRGLTHRYGVPNDLQVRHGPWWPQGRQEIVNVVRRIEAAAPPPPQEELSQDVQDLLQAMGL